MKISKRTMIMVMSLVLTMTVAAFGTVAYMTDSDQVTNTFTVGNISINVDEENVDGDMDADGNIPERDKENNYKLVPGAKYVKDPTITVEANSEDCYVRFRVTLNSIKALSEIAKKHSDVPADQFVNPTPAELLAMFVDIDETSWIYEGAEMNGDVAEIEFRYFTKVLTSETDTVLPELFSTFAVPTYLDGKDLAMLNGLELSVFGDAIQTAAFLNEDAAWEAFDYQIFGEEVEVEETPDEEMADIA